LIRDRALADTVTHAIEDAACEFDLNPWMLATLIRIESSGRPAVVSHAGAIGLTQILPGTAEEIAGKLHVDEYDLTDPATNVRFGAYYVSRLLARFDGNEAAALAAYNYGPTFIARAIRHGETLPTVYADKILTRYASR
jgi:soluble lytic murein transglycosylase